jgi:ABC-2 type transport system ATP-binding protein
MEDNVIEVNELTKRFGDLAAVDHIGFTIKEGEIFGFLGPNGAGKSTCIKMLTTLLHPTSGSAKICGYDVVKEQDQVRSCIGVVFQDRSSDRFLTGRQNLDFHARMYSMSKEEREENISDVMDLLELKGKENIKLNRLPEGLRRRFEVARGFMTYPKVVFLDEPTIGFDIKARMDLWDQIRRAKEKEGVTVVLTTHYIEEADYLCDRVAIIDHAKIIAIDTPEKLKESVGTDLISLQIANRNNGDFMETVKELDWVTSAEEYSNSLLLNVESGEGRVPELIDFADENGFLISSIDEHKPSLEDVFVHFTGRTIRDAEGSVKERRARMKRRK